MDHLTDFQTSLVAKPVANKQIGFVKIMIPAYLAILSFFILLTVLSGVSLENSSHAAVSVKKQFISKVDGLGSNALLSKNLGDDEYAADDFILAAIELAMSVMNLKPDDIAHTDHMIKFYMAPDDVFYHQDTEIYPNATEFFQKLMLLAHGHKVSEIICFKFSYHAAVGQWPMLPQYVNDQLSTLVKEVAMVGFAKNPMLISYKLGQYNQLTIEIGFI